MVLVLEKRPQLASYEIFAKGYEINNLMLTNKVANIAS